MTSIDKYYVSYGKSIIGRKIILSNSSPNLVEHTAWRPTQFSIIFIVILMLVSSCANDDGAASTTETKSSQSVTQSLSNTGLSADQASSHVGEKATVCGTVADSNYAASSNGRPTFLNFDEPYPLHKFTVVIWGSERSKFPNSPQDFYRYKQVCASGLIELYKGKAQIVARSESQLVIQ